VKFVVMLHGEVFAVCFQIHTKHVYALRGHNAEFLNIKPCGTWSTSRLWTVETFGKTVYAIGLWRNLFSVIRPHVKNYFSRKEITQPIGVTLHW